MLFKNTLKENKMNLLQAIKNKFFPQGAIQVEIIEGIVTSKHRDKKPPMSYSMYLPNSVLMSAYLENPDVYDVFKITVNNKTMSVPKEVWSQVEVNQKVKIKHTFRNSGSSLISLINDLSYENWTVES